MFEKMQEKEAEMLESVYRSSSVIMQERAIALDALKMFYNYYVGSEHKMQENSANNSIFHLGKRVADGKSIAGDEFSPVTFRGVPVTDDAPLPHFAIKRADGYMEIGAILATRDGRMMGNAVVIGLEDKLFDSAVFKTAKIQTEMGNTLNLTENEMKTSFHKPIWVCNINDHRATIIKNHTKGR